MVGSGFRAHLKVPTCSGTRLNKKRGPIFGSHHPSSLESQVVPSSSKIFWRTSSTFTALCTESAHPRSITPLSAGVLYRCSMAHVVWSPGQIGEEGDLGRRFEGRSWLILVLG